jgi:hypothetical protein
MALAAAFARPASSPFTRPGAASLWSPPRPFPALAWLAQRHASAARSVAPTRKPASAPGRTCQRVPGEPLRLNLELRWLFCRYTPAPDEDFFTALRIELGRRAWSLEHAIGAPRPAWFPAPGTESDLEKRRARLATDVNLGLAIVESAPVRYPRPVRNVLLVKHARLIGRCLCDLLAHPEAGSLSDELTRLLDALRRAI